MTRKRRWRRDGPDYLTGRRDLGGILVACSRGRWRAEAWGAGETMPKRYYRDLEKAKRYVEEWLEAAAVLAQLRHALGRLREL